MSALPNMVGGSTSTAYSINSGGSIVGWTTDASGKKRAALWQPGGTLQVAIDGGLAGIGGAEALDINDQGQVVGFGLFSGQERAFVYDPLLGSRRLDQVLGVAGAGWTFVRAQGINSHGDIVGYGLYNGQTRAFLASPVPEPASALALLAGAALLRLKRRRNC
jgi:probable HAF family extracellular repeat protein